MMAACLVVVAALSSTLAHADQRADFLAGRTRECQRCRPADAGARSCHKRYFSAKSIISVRHVVS